MVTKFLHKVDDEVSDSLVQQSEDKLLTELIQELENDILNVLRKSGLKIFENNIKNFHDLINSRELNLKLCRILQEQTRKFDYQDIEAITSYIRYWDTNYNSVNRPARKMLVAQLLNKFKIDDYSLLSVYDNLKNRNDNFKIELILEPLVRYWYENDPESYWIYRDIFWVSDDKKSVLKNFEYYDKYINRDVSFESDIYSYQQGLGIYLSYSVNSDPIFDSQDTYSEKAREFILKAIDKNDNEAFYHNTLGLIEYRAGLMEKSLGLKDQANEYLKKAAESYERAIELNENEKYIIFDGNAGDAYYEMEDYDKAIKIYNKCIKIQPQNSRYKKSCARCYNELGIEHSANDRIQDSLKFYKMAQDKIKTLSPPERDKDYIIYLTNIANAYRKLALKDSADKDRNKALAIEHYDKAAELDKDLVNKAKYLNYCGVIYYEHGQYKESIEYFQKAIQMSPETLLYYSNLANGYNSIFEYEKPVVFYKMAMKYMDEDNTRAEAYNYLGVAYSNLGKDRRALGIYKKAQRLNPDNSLYYANIGYSYYKLKKYKIANGYYEKAYSDRKNPSALTNYYYGLVSQELGDKIKAKQLFKEAMDLEEKPLYKNAYNSIKLPARDAK